MRELDKKYADNPTKANAEKVAATVKGQHPVFQELRVVEDENSFDYQYRTPQAQAPVKVETAPTGERVVQRMKKKNEKPPHNSENIFTHDISNSKSKDRSSHARSGNRALRKSAKGDENLKSIIDFYQKGWVDGNSRDNPNGLQWDHSDSDKIILMTEEAHTTKTANDPGSMGGWALHHSEKAEENRALLNRQEEILSQYDSKVVHSTIYTGNSNLRSSHRRFGNRALKNAIQEDSQLEQKILTLDSDAYKKLEEGNNISNHEWDHKKDDGNKLNLLPQSYHNELTSISPGRKGGYSQNYSND